MRARWVKLRCEDGVTLVELMESMAVIALVFAGFATMLSATIRHTDNVQEYSALQTEARAAVDTLTRDLRQAYTGNSASAIESISGTQIRFLSPDRATPFRLRRIAYQVSGGALQRAFTTSTNTGGPPWTIPATLGPWQTQVGSITNLAPFTFFDTDGVVTADPTKVRTMKIQLVLARAAEPARKVTYQATVTLRGEQQ